MPHQARIKDRRRESLNDNLKHIVNELDIANTALQLAMSDLSHYMKDLQELNKEGENEHSSNDTGCEVSDKDSASG